MSFDEQYHVQNVRVINKLSWLEMMLAVAVGVAVGGVAVIFVLAALGSL